MAERGAEDSRKLFSAYLSKFPKTPEVLDYTQGQQKELGTSLGRINDNPTSTLDNGIEIGSVTDKSGRKLVITNYPELKVKELKVVATNLDKLPQEITKDPGKLRDFTEPYGPSVGPFKAHMMRLFMVDSGANKDKDIAVASMAGESLPRLGLRSRDGFGSKALMALGLAALFDIKVEEGNRLVLTVDMRGQEPMQQTLVVLSRQFTHGTGSYSVYGRVANIGRELSRAA